MVHRLHTCATCSVRDLGSEPPNLIVPSLGRPGKPSVSFTYDRLGRQATVTTDGQATHTFTYDDDPADTTTVPPTLRLLTEDIDGVDVNGFYDKLITRKQEGQGGNLLPGRDAGFQIGSSGDPDEDYDIGYYYNGYGQLVIVTGPGLPASGTWYTRTTDSDLIATTQYKTGPTATVVSATRSYEADRDLITSVANVYDPAGTADLISEYDYTNDDLNRRIRMEQTGTAFGSDRMFLYHDPTDENVSGYNDRGELVHAWRRQGTTPPGTAFGSDYDFTYDYDAIGNRETSGHDGTSTPYDANDLNQYASVGSSPEYLCYDADGNLIRDGKASSTCPGTDGRYIYAWDAENRLIRIEPVTPAVGDRKVEFAYDYHLPLTRDAP